MTTIKIDYHKAFAKNTAILEHWHTWYEIAIFVKSDIKVFLNDKQYHIRDGDILIIKPNEVHKIVYSVSAEYERYVLNIQKDEFTPILKALYLENLFDELDNDDARCRSTNYKERAELFLLVKEIMTSFNRADKEPLVKLNTAKLLFQINELSRAIHVTNVQTDSQMQSVVLYINKNYMNSITLDKLEKEVYLNRYSISRTFKEYTGFTVTEYLQQKRILEAQKLLITSNKKITEILFDCGFSNIQNFIRTFKKVTFTTPWKYRKKSLP